MSDDTAPEFDPDADVDLELPPAESAEGTAHPVRTFVATSEDAGRRLDLFLTARFPEHSRTWLAKLVDEGFVQVEVAPSEPTSPEPAPLPGSPASIRAAGTWSGTRGARPPAPKQVRKVRPGMHVEPGDLITVQLVPRTVSYAVPEKIPLSIIYEDRWLVVIDKPPHLTVHPGAGEKSGTLANAIAYHFGELSQVQGPMRPGIVHRLDKDTSGVILVAKDDTTHWALATQFRERTVRKEYHAVVRGRVELDADLISAPLGQDRRSPTRMAVRMDIGRPSETYYEVIERFASTTWVRCMPKTGRTHQIRVHMLSIGHAIVSDHVYGGLLPALTPICPRQALHARSLTFRHPQSGDVLTFEAPLPADITALIEHLRNT
ncbi:MAG: RluA family pseudouridine synthase [Planctomycetes bacterium]|nr:RluA family pseudouridine synthase [Planctomycetota bacterium]